MARVLIGCPTSEHKAYCLGEFVTGVRQLMRPGVDALVVDNSKTDAYMERIRSLGFTVIKGPFLPHAKDRIVASRNLLRERFLQGGYDYFLSLEQDVVPPSDVVERLSLHGKDVVSAVVFTKFIVNDSVEYKPLVWGFHPSGNPEMMQFMDLEVWRPGLYEIKACGLGCILISRAALERVSFRLLEDRSTFDDIPFCMDAVKAGYSLYVDTSVKCKHYVEQMNWDSLLTAEQRGEHEKKS